MKRTSTDGGQGVKMAAGVMEGIEWPERPLLRGFSGIRDVVLPSARDT